MFRAFLLVSLLVAAPALATAVGAQAAPAAPEVRVVSVSTFQVPIGEDRDKVLDYMRQWMLEPAKRNPNVLSWRILQHWYGSNAEDVVMVVEYPNWAAVTAPCEPCAAYTAANMPATGTPERTAADAALALFLKYYSTHSDQIYSADLSLAKP